MGNIRAEAFPNLCILNCLNLAPTPAVAGSGCFHSANHNISFLGAGQT